MVAGCGKEIGDHGLGSKDGGNPAVWQTGVLGEPVMGDAQVAECFLERLAGMGVVKERGGFHGGKTMLFTIFANSLFADDGVSRFRRA